MKSTAIAVLFSGILSGALLALFHAFNPARIFFPTTGFFDLSGFYLIGFAAGVLAALLMVKIKKLRLPHK